jgi:hypothetical protein
MLNIAKFRMNMREAFNEAEQGKSVHIERHGVEFVLVRAFETVDSIPVGASILQPAVAVKPGVTLKGVQLTNPKTTNPFDLPKGTVIKTPIPKEMQPKFCKNGHPIPYGRERCLGKGCKYS